MAKNADKAKVWKNSPITVVPIINEEDEGMPDDLKIKYGIRINISWDWFFGLFKKRGAK